MFLSSQDSNSPKKKQSTLNFGMSQKRTLTEIEERGDENVNTQNVAFGQSNGGPVIKNNKKLVKSQTDKQPKKSAS